MLSCSWERLGHRLWTPICVGLLALLAARWSQICAFSFLGTVEPIQSDSSELVMWGLAKGGFGVGCWMLMLVCLEGCVCGFASRGRHIQLARKRNNDA